MEGKYNLSAVFLLDMNSSMDSDSISSANMADVEMDEFQQAVDDSVEMAEEPCSLSVTNVPEVVYKDQEIKVLLN